MDPPKIRLKLTEQQSPPGSSLPNILRISTAAVQQAQQHQHHPKPSRPRVKAKIKLSPHGVYDSDEDESQVAVEEQCILRLPTNDPMTDAFRERVQSRQEWPKGTELTFKDGRRGVFKFQGETFIAELFDLPCIIESQKTLDHKHFVKVADICQLIRISRPPPPSQPNGDAVQEFLEKEAPPPEYYIANSGITPPMKYCRLRRFRKRVNKRTVESIEREVQRLLKEDARALEVQTQLMDAAELEERFGRPEDAGGDDRMAGMDVDQDGLLGAGDQDDGMGLEDEIAKAFAEDGSEAGTEDEDDMSDEDEDEEQPEQEQDELEDEMEQDEDAEVEGGEDYDDDDIEMRALFEQQKLIRDELRDLHDKINEKTAQRQKAMNALIKKRFDDIIAKLTSELELKQGQLEDVENRIQQVREEEIQHQQASEETMGAAVAEGQKDVEQKAMAGTKEQGDGADLEEGEYTDDEAMEEDEDDDDDVEFDERHRGLFGDLDDEGDDGGDEDVALE